MQLFVYLGQADAATTGCEKLEEQSHYVSLQVEEVHPRRISGSFHDCMGENGGVRGYDTGVAGHG